MSYKKYIAIPFAQYQQERELCQQSKKTEAEESVAGEAEVKSADRQQHPEEEVKVTLTPETVTQQNPEPIDEQSFELPDDTESLSKTREEIDDTEEGDPNEKDFLAGPIDFAVPEKVGNNNKKRKISLVWLKP